MPPSSASARKPATSASDTRFEIVMVKRSLAAANAIKAGNSIRRAISRIMGFSPGSRRVGVGAASLAGNGEGSENGGTLHQKPTIRKTSIPIASESARQTSSMERSVRLAATGTATGLRIPIPRLAHARPCSHSALLTHRLANAWTCRDKRPRDCRGLLIATRNNRLFQRGVDRGELVVQVGAEAVDHSDDRQRNAGGNQAVFDGGGAGLVLHETRNKVLHQ